LRMPGTPAIRRVRCRTTKLTCRGRSESNEHQKTYMRPRSGAAPGSASGALPPHIGFLIQFAVRADREHKGMAPEALRIVENQKGPVVFQHVDSKQRKLVPKPFFGQRRPPLRVVPVEHSFVHLVRKVLLECQLVSLDP